MQNPVIFPYACEVSGWTISLFFFFLKILPAITGFDFWSFSGGSSV